MCSAAWLVHRRSINASVQVLMDGEGHPGGGKVPMPIAHDPDLVGSTTTPSIGLAAALRRLANHLAA